MAVYLDIFRIEQIIDAAVETRIVDVREALLRGIDDSVVRGLAEAPDPRAQLLLDLKHLNQKPEKAKRTISGAPLLLDLKTTGHNTPILIWLQNASSLATDLPQARVFGEAERDVLAQVQIVHQPVGSGPLWLSRSLEGDVGPLQAIQDVRQAAMERLRWLGARASRAAAWIASRLEDAGNLLGGGSWALRMEVDATFGSLRFWQIAAFLHALRVKYRLPGLRLAAISRESSAVIVAGAGKDIRALHSKLEKQPPYSIAGLPLRSVQKTTTRAPRGGKKAPLVFVSSTDADTDWRDLVVQHLGVLLVDKRICVWTGEPNKTAQGLSRDAALSRAAFAVILITADLLASGAHRKEGVLLFERSDQAQMRAYPLLTRPCAWKAAPWISSRALIPANGKALTLMTLPEVEQELTVIVMSIAEALSSAGTGRHDRDAA